MGIVLTMGPVYADHRLHAEKMLRAAIAAADPGAAVRRSWQKDPVKCRDGTPVLLLAMGKSSLEMAAAAVELLHLPPEHAVIAAVPERMARAEPLQARCRRLIVLPGDHPLPTERSAAAGRAILDAASSFRAAHGASGTVCVLLSGGASSQTAVPAGGLAVDDLRAVQEALQKAGAGIDALNCVRKHTEKLKGGRLAALLWPCRVEVFAASDVIGDLPDVIASGPFSADPTTFADAMAIMERYMPDTPAAPALEPVREHLRRGVNGDEAESVKAGDPRLAQVRYRTVCSNTDALRAVGEHAASQGIVVGACTPMETPTIAREGGEALASRAMGDLASMGEWCGARAWVAGGEPVVDTRDATVPCGIGGPSQELVLSAWRAIARRGGSLDGVRFVAAAFSTDGIDGPTDAAGGVLSAESVQKGGGLAALEQAIARHDATRFLDDAGGVLRTGPTGVNVNHIAMVIAYRERT